MNWKHRTLILPYELVDIAKAACIALTGSASEGLFSVPLYKKGSLVTETPDYAISSGYIAGEFADALPCVSYEILEDGSEKETKTEGNIAILLMKLADAEFEISIEELQALLEQLYISDEEGYIAVNRLGLSFSVDSHSIDPII